MTTSSHKTSRKKQISSVLLPALVRRDPYLEPYAKMIDGRARHAIDKANALTRQGSISLKDFASGHLYYGLHHDENGWVFREWAPHATRIVLVGDFSRWEEREEYSLVSKGNHGDWEIRLPESSLSHGQHYKLKVYWDGGEGERIPAWADSVVQDPDTHLFCARVWKPDYPYRFRHGHVAPHSPLLIYECHVGMAQDKEGVGTYDEFRCNILPRIVKDGYNCIQIMAIQEHPYYGSFGYHVSSFFAPSSRFGTPDDLKALIDEAHSLGLTVIMDLVHSHAVKNEAEGLGNLAGDPCQFFCQGDRRIHNQWDSLCFDYGKDEVLHFLLSNCRYWLEEFRFDGFRFDGVTSMLYYSHGLGESFMDYNDYFNGHQDDDAICYLMLANKLIHEVEPKAVTIAEEVSGMPGLAAPLSDGGYGFDFRLAMNIPDYWIKTIKECRDENWKPSSLYWEMTNRRSDERTISYCESHDQALVGDKTLIFRLVDADMYWHFAIADQNDTVHRGIALHKMIRLLTSSTINGGYLNFMGNEFGHPEWIDFPREGNGWSYKYARRQWNLVDNPNLCYRFLGDFDREMLKVMTSIPYFEKTAVQEVWHDDADQMLAYLRGDLLYVFNFNPVKSFVDYGFLVTKGEYRVCLNTDHPQFGGNGLTDDSVKHFTLDDPLYDKEGKGWLQLYVPARTAVVLKKMG